MLTHAQLRTQAHPLVDTLTHFGSRVYYLSALSVICITRVMFSCDGWISQFEQYGSLSQVKVF